MVRPRFAKLPAAQQQAILRAALDEFAAHGFHDASLNRVIEAAGISKGSMYYYFDGKEDLYAHVAHASSSSGCSPRSDRSDPGEADADAFWSALEGYYLQLMTALAASPQLAALIRGWLAASAKPGDCSRHKRRWNRLPSPWMEACSPTGQQRRRGTD